MTRKIAIGFVVFNPDVTFLDRVTLCSDSGFASYIFDNSPNKSLVRDHYRDLKNSKYSTCGKNVGLGFGISSICAQAYYDSYTALVFFDQDTVFDLSTLEFIEAFHFSNNHLKEVYSAIVFNSKAASNKNFKNQFEFKDVQLAISSGSLFFLENLHKMNWHNVNYFVDCVDYEFCLNSANNKFKIGECSLTPGFDHVTEQADSLYKIFGKELMMRRYSLKRIIDTTFASAKLIFKSIITTNLQFASAIIRSWGIYITAQFLVRLTHILSRRNG